MSAKWRRNKRTAKRFNIFKVFSKTKGRSSPRQTFRFKSTKVKRQNSPRRFRVQNFSTGKELRDPQPLIDVFEENDEVTVIAEFAGFNEENLKVRVKNQRLTLTAEASERRYHKSLNLPKRVIPSTIRTKYKNGVLEIRLKKAVEEKTINKVAG